MFKKLALVGLAAAVVLGLFFGRDAVSYVSTLTGSVRDAVQESVPIEFEIKRAQEMITNLDEPIKKNYKAIAKEEVAVQKLADQVDEMKVDLAKARDQILRLNDDLRSNDAEFVYNDKVYTVSQVKTDLAARFDRFKSQESTTFKLEQVLEARNKGLDAAREKLNAMLSAKRDLEVKLADLQARQKLVEVHEASSEFTSSLDDSQLARTKSLVEDIESRIDVAEKLINTHSELNFEIQLDEPSESGDITSQVTDYFGAGRADVEALVSTRGE